MHGVGVGSALIGGGWFGSLAIIDFGLRALLFVAVVAALRVRARGALRLGAAWGVVALLAALVTVWRSRSLWGAVAVPTLAALYWFFSEGRNRRPNRPAEMLVQTTDDVTIALSGALAGFALMLWADWVAIEVADLGGEVDAVAAVVMPFGFALLGAVLAPIHTRLRQRWPRKLALRHHEGSEVGPYFWYQDFLIIPPLTPILWTALESVMPAWRLFFLYFLVVLPAYYFYRLWTYAFERTLRWFGNLRSSRGMLQLANARLAKSEPLTPWLPSFALRYTPAKQELSVVGALPSIPVRAALERALRDLDPELQIDLSRLAIDTKLQPARPATSMAEAVRARREAKSQTKRA